MSRGSAAVMLLAFVAALALRIPKLDLRPFHNDEGVNAIKVCELWEHGRYKYDPDEYHGPTLHYATLPFLWLSGAKDANSVGDATFRLAPVTCGVGLILLLLLFVDGLGRQAIAWAAIFTAVSPAMVFYSRYFIHEMPLVFFTALVLGAGWRYVRTRAARWALVAGSGVGLMWATKETFVITMAAMVIALALTVWRAKRAAAVNHGKAVDASTAEDRKQSEFSPVDNHKPLLRHLGLGALAVVVVWLVFFSSFFTNFGGLADSIKTYLPWLKRAGGHSPHIHPWYFYLARLWWFHPAAKGPAWSEGLILVLAAIGAGVSLIRPKSTLQQFLVLYTLILTAAYAAISYKTPWCLLSFYFGMILLAGVGAAALLDLLRARSFKVLAAICLVALTGNLAWQAWRASFVYAADKRNPYVYAQTAPNLLELVERVEGIARVAPGGHNTIVKVIAADGDYWPLPWYLRRFKHVGWYDRVPSDPYSAIMIVSWNLHAGLDDKSNKKWLMAGGFELRPRVYLELYVELELWKKYVETLPREKD